MLVVKTAKQASYANWKLGVEEMIFGIKLDTIVTVDDILTLGALLPKVKFYGKDNTVVNVKIKQILVEKLAVIGNIDLPQGKSKVVLAKLAALQTTICDVEEETFEMPCAFEDGFVGTVFYSEIAEKPEEGLMAEAYKEVTYKKFYPKCQFTIKVPEKVPGWIKKDDTWEQVEYFGTDKCKTLMNKFKGLTFIDCNGHKYNHYTGIVKPVFHVDEKYENYFSVMKVMLDLGNPTDEELVEIVKLVLTNENAFFTMVNLNLSLQYYKDNWFYIPTKYKAKLANIIKDRINKGLMAESDDTVVSFGDKSLFEFTVFDEENCVEDILDDESDIEDEEIEGDEE